MDTTIIFGFPVSNWIILPLVFLLWVTILLFIKRVFFGAMKKLVNRTKTPLDNIFLEAADFPVTLLIFTSAGALVERVAPAVLDTELTNYLLIGFKAATIVAVILFFDKFANNSIRQYSDKVEALKSTGGIARGIARIVVIGLGVLILLDSFGVSITPIVASLGIGSLAVALALQPTLENFFSGIQIIVDKPFVVGQFIKLESGEEGYVHKIGWRSTWIRMLQNNMIVMPNKVVVDSRVTNYYYPDKQLAVLVQVGVHYQSDLEHVEKVTMEVAKETLQSLDGGVKDFDPFIRYHTFADFSINFTVIMRAHEFVDNYLIKHEFVKRLHKRYAQEGINIPYPIRAINHDQEKSFEKMDKE